MGKQGFPGSGQGVGVGHGTLTHFARAFTEEERNTGRRNSCRQLGREASTALAPRQVQLCEVHSGQELTAFPALSREASCFPFGTFPINGILEEWLQQLSTVVATCLDKSFTSLDFKISPNKRNFLCANK